MAVQNRWHPEVGRTFARTLQIIQGRRISGPHRHSLRFLWRRAAAVRVRRIEASTLARAATVVKKSSRRQPLYDERLLHWGTASGSNIMQLHKFPGCMSSGTRGASRSSFDPPTAWSREAKWQVGNQNQHQKSAHCAVLACAAARRMRAGVR